MELRAARGALANLVSGGTASTPRSHVRVGGAQTVERAQFVPRPVPRASAPAPICLARSKEPLQWQLHPTRSSAPKTPEGPLPESASRSRTELAKGMRRRYVGSLNVISFFFQTRRGSGDAHWTSGREKKAENHAHMVALYTVLVQLRVTAQDDPGCPGNGGGIVQNALVDEGPCRDDRHSASETWNARPLQKASARNFKLRHYRVRGAGRL